MILLKHGFGVYMFTVLFIVDFIVTFVAGTNNTSTCSIGDVLKLV